MESSPPTPPAPDPIAAEILRQVTDRADGSICPTDVARALREEWRPILSQVRRVAVRLAREGRIDILRKGKPVAPEEMRGVIRLRLHREG